MAPPTDVGTDAAGATPIPVTTIDVPVVVPRQRHPGQYESDAVIVVDTAPVVRGPKVKLAVALAEPPF
jgi:hypothetical protein